VFCAPLDTDFNAIIPCGHVPGFPQGTSVIDNDVYKYGGGSAKVSARHNSIIWSNLSGQPANEGAIGIWVREPQYVGYFGDKVDGLDANMVRIGRSTGFLTLVMRDSTGAPIINWVGAKADVAGWHYLEVNWLWNAVGGFTKLTRDGVVEMTSTAGNTKSRDALAQTTIFMETNPFLPDDTYWVDDFVVWDEVQHSGDFTPPEAAQCAGCAPTIVLNFGRPGGWGFGYGFGN
jgi:hypothetical protein